MRMIGVLATAGAALLMAACGSTTGPGPGDAPTTTSPDLIDVDPDDELVGQGTLLQESPDAPVEFCVGGVLESYPPQCGGPVLVGDFSWDQVRSETASGVTWSSVPHWAVGHYDPDDGEHGSFTLTRQVSADPPEGWAPPEPADPEFPQLCADPTADVPDVDQAARTQGPTGMVEEQALLELLQTLDGYVTSWVSDGGPTFNVVVNGDPGQARAEIREVFTGPLCVEQRDLPSEQEVRAAQEALSARGEELRLTFSGSGGGSGLLEVETMVADQATVDAIHDTVEEWLTPEQVVVRGTLQPLRQR